MYKKNLIKATSVLTAFALAFTTMAGCGLKKNEEENVQQEALLEDNKEADELVDTMTKTAFTGSKENAESGKEETVYVMTDANGAVDEVVVSNWLKNADNSKTLKDTTNLKDIVNVKGEESYTDNGDGTVTWDAEGSDIYYQGTPTEELPIGVKVTYTLDGKEISADEIAGKSGRVAIRFDYDNTLTKEVEIDGEKENIDVPFTMISGTMLDNEKFANVKVSNGKVISDANNFVVVGVAMPGLKESLKIADEKLSENDLDEEDVEIPDYVEITADVNDFELPMTISMASANVISDLGLDKIYNSDKVDNINDDMDELQDASTKLRDGSGDLADGTGKFSDGTKELKDGTSKLKDGTKELKDGTSELRSGAGELANGAGTLATGTGTLSSGIGAYTDAVGTLANGAGTLDSGVGKLKSGTQDLSKGIGSAADGSKDLATGAAQLSTGIDTAANEVKKNLDAVTLAKNTFYNAYKTVIDAAASQAGAATKAAAPEQADISSMISELSGKLAEAYAQGMAAEASKAENLEKELADKDKTIESLTQQAEEASKKADEVAEPETPENNDADNSDNSSSGNTEPSGDNGNESQASTDNNSSENNESSGSETDGNQNAAADNSEQTDSNTQTENSTQADATTQSDEVNGEETSQAEESSETSETTSDETATTQETPAPEAQENTSSEEQAEPVTLSEGTDEVSGVEEYADEAGWAAVAALTKIDKSQWDQMYQYAVQTMQASNSDTQKKQMMDLIKNANTAISAGDQEMAAGIAAQRQGKAEEAAGHISKATAYYTGALTALSQYVVTPASNTAQYVTTIYMTYNTLASSEMTLNQLYNGTGQGGLKDIQAGASKLATGANDLYAGMKKLDNGGSKLYKGIVDLKKGTDKLSEGANTLNSKSSELKEGAGKLSEGANQLSEGASKLSEGTGTLDDGVGELNDGAIKLDDGAAELNNGAKELDDGAKKLADGMVEFDEDGIQKLTSTVDEDLLAVTDRLKAVDEASQSYNTFSGANSDEPSTVQFIIRTAGISADED